MSNLKNIVFRRKKKFINAKSQISIGIWLVLHSLLFFGLVMLVLFMPPVANWLNPGINYRILMTDFFNLLAAKWPFLILILAIMIIAGNLFSHRIVGPEFRFKQILKSLLEKDLNIHFKLRKLDYHKDLERGFKDYINTLKENIKKMRKDVDETKTALDKQEVGKAKESLNNLKKEIDSYKM